MAKQTYPSGTITQYNTVLHFNDILRADGAIVDQATYPSLFKAIGFTNNISPRIINNGQPWNQQFNINLSQSVALGEWSFGNYLPEYLNGYKVLVTNSRIYLIGGREGNYSTNAIYYANIGDKGIIDKWVLSTDVLPTPISDFTLVVIFNKVYLLGGVIDLSPINGGVSSVLSTVYSATINDDGSIGTWAWSSSLPVGISNAQAVVTDKMLYLFSGNISGSVGMSPVRSCPIDVNGGLGNWYLNTVDLPYNIKNPATAFVGDKIYLLGGSVDGVYTDKIYYAIPNNVGLISSWVESDTALPKLMGGMQTVVTNNAVYLIGGCTDDNINSYLDTVYSITLTADYKFSQITPDYGPDFYWIKNKSIDRPVTNAQIAATYSKLYLVGGNGEDGPLTKTYFTDFNNNTSNYNSSFSLVTTPQVTDSRPVCGQPWKQQSNFNTSINLSSRRWVTGNTLPGTITAMNVVVTVSKVFVIGGLLDGIPSSNVYSAIIDANGVVGSFGVEVNSLPGAIYEAQTIITSNKIYTLGGVLSDTIYTAIINPDGTISSWTTAGNLPATISHSQSAVISNCAYLFGGIINGSISSAVYYAPIDVNGVIGSWSIGTSLPVALQSSELAIVGNYIYLFGGKGITNEVSSVYFASVNNITGLVDGWTFDQNLPVLVSMAKTVVTDSQIYLIGGNSGTNVLSTVYRAPITGGNSVGTFVLDTPLPIPLKGFDVLVTSSGLYTIGGTTTNGDIQATYLSSFSGGLNSYILTARTDNYMGKPWQSQYNFNGFNNGDLNDWSTLVNKLGYTVYATSIIVTNNYIYIIGGTNLSVTLANISKAIINTDGTLGNFINEPNVPSNLFQWSQAFITNNRVYVIGGCNTAAVPTAFVTSAPINTDGTLGVWVTGTSLPEPIHSSQIVVTGTNVYLIGGVGSLGGIDKVYTTTINTDGTINAWTLLNTLPSIAYSHQAFKIKDYIYVISGSNVYRTIIDNTGVIGNWTTLAPFPVMMRNGTSIVTNNTVYMLGGLVNEIDNSAVYYAPIDVNGNIGAWTLGTPLPTNLSRISSAIVNNKAYIIGGLISNNTASNSIYMATFLGGYNNYVSDQNNQIVYIDGQPWKQQYDFNKTQSVIAYTPSYINGSPWNQQYDFNGQQTGDITGWITESNVIPIGVYFSNILITNKYVHIIGGQSLYGPYNNIQSAPINNDGTLGLWTSTGGAYPVRPTIPTDVNYSCSTIATRSRVYVFGGVVNSIYQNTVIAGVINIDGTLGQWYYSVPFPVALAFTQSIIIQDKAYILGGYTGTVAVNTVYVATVNPDDTLGPWVLYSNSLFEPLYGSQVALIGNKIYLIGGLDKSTVYVASVDINGNIGTWSLYANSLPTILAYSNCVVTKNMVYMIGGYDPTHSTANIAYYAPIDINGNIGIWSIGTSLPQVRDAGRVAVTSSRIYYLGGSNTGWVATPTIQSAPFLGGHNNYMPDMSIGGIPALGALTAWIPGTNLVSAIAYSQSLITKDHAYLLGGRTSVDTNIVYIAPIDINGVLGTWSSSSTLPFTLSQASIFITKKYVYIVGGYQDNVITNSIYSAPIDSNGLIGTFTYNTVFPIALAGGQAVMNGGFVYIVGGFNLSGMNPWLYHASIDQNGVIGPWVATTAPPVAYTNSVVVLTKNIIYQIGGTIDGVNGVNTVYYAPINMNGDVGSWINGINLPLSLFGAQYVIANEIIYLFGGYQNNILSSNIYLASIGIDGIIGVWLQDISLQVATAFAQTIVTDSNVYLLGGIDSSSAKLSTSYMSSFSGGYNDYSTIIDAPGITSYVINKYSPWKNQSDFNISNNFSYTKWTLAGTITTNMSNSQTVVTNNHAYILGGDSGTGQDAKVYSATIDGNGVISGFNIVQTAIPVGLSNLQVFVTTNRLYLLASQDSINSIIAYSATINVDGTLGAWVIETGLPVATWSSQVVSTGTRAYMCGGNIATGASSVVYSAPINSDGTIGAWIVELPLPEALYYSSVIVTNSKIYLLGGQNASNQCVSTVYMATIDTSGSIGGWLIDGSIPVAMSAAQAVVTSTRAYLIGGYNGTIDLSEVYTAPIDNNGILGTWVLDTNLPVGISHSSSLVYGDYLYLTGGVSGTYVNTIYSTPFTGGLTNYMGLSESVTYYPFNYFAKPGQPWKQQYDFNNAIITDAVFSYNGMVLPTMLGNAQAIITKNRVYVFGGWDGTNVVNTVYTASININGILGNWIITTPLPSALSRAQAIFTSKRVYLIGGYDGTNVVSTVYSAPLLTDGTIGAWITDIPLPTPLSCSQAAVIKDTLYVFGGNENPTLTGVLNDIIYKAIIDPDGIISSWINYSTLPVPLSNSHIIVTDTLLYIAGGNKYTPDVGYGGSISATSDVYSTIINVDGTLVNPWVTESSLPGAKFGGQVVVTKHAAFIIGGDTTTLYIAPIDNNGNIGSWVTGTSLASIRIAPEAIVTSSKLYLLGGYDNSGYGGVVYSDILESTFDGGLNNYASINSDNALLTRSELPFYGQPWCSQYSRNIVMDKPIISWTRENDLYAPLTQSQAMVTKNMVYLIGGYDGVDYSAVTYSAPVDKYGVIGTWSVGPTLIIPLARSQVIMFAGHIYLIGGYNSSGVHSTIYTSIVNTDGTISDWSIYSQALPGALSDSQAIVTKNYVYMLGGYDGVNYTDVVYYAPISVDGILGAFIVDQPLPILPRVIARSHATIAANRAYLIGGYDGISGSNYIYTSVINMDGILGPWYQNGETPTECIGGQILTTANAVYLIGGYNEKLSPTVASYYTKIKTDGTIGEWMLSKELPIGLGDFQAVITNNRLYILGGEETSNVSSAVFSAPFNGGSNDYISLIVNRRAYTRTQFTLPDLTAHDIANGVYSYISI